MALVVTVTPIDLDTKNSNILEEQRDYARLAVHHGLLNKKHYEEGNSPFHGDLMYHQMFNTDILRERMIYTNVSQAWMHDAKEAHVYIDLGISESMVNYIKDLKKHDIDIKFKSLNEKRYMVEALSKLSSIEEAKDFLDSAAPIMKVGNQFIKHEYSSDYLYRPRMERFPEKDLIPINLENNDYKRIILESPFAGDVKNNVLYAKQLIHDLSHKGYAPSASHLLYTQMLNDNKEFERNLGINKGLDYAHNKDSLIGIDRGISTGMKYGVKRAENEGRNYNFVTLSEDLEIQKMVERLRDIKDAEDFVSMQISKNKDLYEMTGFINNTKLSEDMTLFNKSNKTNFKNTKKYTGFK